MDLPSMQTSYRCLRHPSALQGGSAAPAEKQVASTATPQTSQSSSLKSIMRLLPIIVIALAVLFGIELLKKD